MLNIQLIGPFSISDTAEQDRKPQLMKSRAILAALAALPDHRHTRAWMQNLLWPDRSHAQCLSSLRTALADIRRNLGPYADALQSDHYDVWLDPGMIQVDLYADPLPHSDRQFLEGFSVSHSPVFDAWLRDQRSQLDANRVRNLRRDVPEAKPAIASAPVAPSDTQTCRLLLAAPSQSAKSLGGAACEALTDYIAKTAEDLGIAEPVDLRGRGETIADFKDMAQSMGCALILAAELQENGSEGLVRLRIVETGGSGRLLWSKTIPSNGGLDFNDANQISLVAESIEILSDQLLRPYRLTSDTMPPGLLAASGIKHVFRLGADNYQTADTLFAQAYDSSPNGSFLAWRAYLRTLMLGEMDFDDRQTVVEEGTSLARRALELDPNNSMVLALCAQVDNMLHDAYESAFDLAARALEINRGNPLAWASLGVAAGFLDNADKGLELTKVGARLASGRRGNFMIDALTSSAGLLAGDLETARYFAERSHMRSPDFAPPLRFLSALYSYEGQHQNAAAAAEKLRVREPDFTLSRLKDEGYPADSLRRAKLLDALPGKDV